MSNTPKTDAFFNRIDDSEIDMSQVGDFCRDLERENAALRKDSARLRWLHTGGGSGARKEWGVAEIEFDANGKVIGAFWGFSDSSDIDKAMAEEFADEDPNLRMNQPDIHGSGGHGG